MSNHDDLLNRLHALELLERERDEARKEARRLRDVLERMRPLCWCQPTPEGFVVCTICVALAETDSK